VPLGRSLQELKISLSRLAKDREHNCIAFVSNFRVTEIDKLQKKILTEMLASTLCESNDRHQMNKR
jgi:hypothetical protein